MFEVRAIWLLLRMITVLIFVVHTHRPPSNIVDVAVSNNIVAIALNNNELMRLDLSNPSEIDRKYTERMWLTGYNSVSSNECLCSDKQQSSEFKVMAGQRAVSGQNGNI